MLTFSASARKDLREILVYIADEFGDPESAQRTVQEIIHRINRLVSFPRSGTAVDELSSKRTEYRLLIAGKYVVVYRLHSNKVDIVRIIHASADYTRLF